MDASMNNAVLALKAQSQALSNVSNNLANSSTSGYKAVTTQFLSMVTGTSGTTSQNNSGGVRAETRQNVTATGTITSTSKSTDMAIDGTGFFVVSDGTNDYYTRNGAFDTDSSGNMYMSGTDYYLMGWPTNSTGTVTATNAGNVSSLEKVDLKKAATNAKATTSYTLAANLPNEEQAKMNTVSYDSTSSGTQTLNYSWVSTGTLSTGGSQYMVSVTSSDSSVTLDDGSGGTGSQLTYMVETDSTGAIANVYGTTGGTIGYSSTTDLPTSITVTDSSGGTTSVDTSSETWSTVKAGANFTTPSSMTVYDTKGGSESFPVKWTAAGDNTWIMTVSAPTDSTGSVTTGHLADSSGVSVNSYSYSVTFNTDGSFKSVTALSQENGGTVSKAPVDDNGSALLKTYDLNGTSASNLNVTLNLGTAGKTDGLSEFNSGSSDPAIAIKTTSQDGVAYGTLKNVTVDSAGQVVATYTNDATAVLYKVPLAVFANADGLSAMTNGVYHQTTSSGDYTLNTAGENGVGTIQSSALENSTVDTSTEFSNMISCQQAYSAASQVISTGKQMVQSLLQAVQ